MRRQDPFRLVEPKWQRHLRENATFRAFDPGETIPESHPPYNGGRVYPCIYGVDIHNCLE